MSYLGAAHPAYLQGFAPFLGEKTAKGCVQKMIDHKEGKPLVKFMKSALAQGDWKENHRL